MKKIGLALLLIFSLVNVWADPARVIIIRHAEKPKVGNDLDTKGWERASALPYYFQSFNKENTIVAIYAAHPSQKHPSHRPEQTCTPTAQSLHLSLNTQYGPEDYAVLAQAIKSNPAYQGKTILICWQHQYIPAMTKALGAINRPSYWPPHIFDATWIINYNQDGLAHLKIDSQRLLYGDAKNVKFD